MREKIEINKDEMEKLLLEGATANEVAEHFHVTSQTIRTRAKEYGLEFKKRKPLTKEILIEKYHEQKMSLQDISTETGWSPAYIRQKMIKLGVERRTTYAGRKIKWEKVTKEETTSTDSSSITENVKKCDQFIIADDVETDDIEAENVKAEDIEVKEVKMTKLEKHQAICDTLHETYEMKNNDYGDSFSKTRTKYPNAILIRLEDKLNRLATLMSGGEAMVVDESINDTLLDLANYAIMELIERDRVKQ